MEQILIMLNNPNSVLFVESFPAEASTIFCDKLRTCRYCTAACTCVKILASFCFVLSVGAKRNNKNCIKTRQVVCKPWNYIVSFVWVPHLRKVPYGLCLYSFLFNFTLDRHFMYIFHINPRKLKIWQYLARGQCVLFVWQKHASMTVQRQLFNTMIQKSQILVASTFYIYM